MVFEFSMYTGIASAATIGPVYKIRKALAKLFKIPYLGWGISLFYGLAVSWLFVHLFGFQSSLAGLANLASSIIFSAWLYFESKKLDAKKAK